MIKEKRLRSVKAQEEMIGFGLIIVIVAVILLVFLSFSLKNSNDDSKDYEVSSFLQSTMQFTSDCEEYSGNYFTMQDLIVQCGREGICLDGREICDVLNNTLKEIVDASWDVGAEWPNKGYLLRIDSSEKEILKFDAGNVTRNSKSSFQEIPNRGNDILISFTIYY
jgi:hypothetical protein